MNDTSKPTPINKSPVKLRSKHEESFFPMTPAQYFDERMRRRHLDGETRLLFAVLGDAIRCYVLAAGTGRPCHIRARDEVRDWVNRGEHDIFSFDAICGVFDIEPDALRKQLNALTLANVRLRRFRTVDRSIVIKADDRRRRAKSRNF